MVSFSKGLLLWRSLHSENRFPAISAKPHWGSCGHTSSYPLSAVPQPVLPRLSSLDLVLCTHCVQDMQDSLVPCWQAIN